MKETSIRQSQEHLRYIHKTLDVPYQELLSVINNYRVDPQTVAQYLKGLTHGVPNREMVRNPFGGTHKYF